VDFGIIVASMTETPTLSFAENLRLSRKKLGMTQQQLGEALGYSRSAIIKFEKGINIPPRRSIDGITMMLNLYLLANS
jgi:transcriptional regulator with XRE-family HTH domain